MLKILTTQIREKIHSVTRCGLFLKEQKEKQEEQVTCCTLISTSPQRAKRSRKCSYGIDRQQKSLWYDLANLDYRLLENVQDIWQSVTLCWAFVVWVCVGASQRITLSILARNPLKGLVREISHGWGRWSIVNCTRSINLTILPNAHSLDRICQREWNAKNSLGFWDTSGLTNPDQTTRHSSN